MSGPILKRQTVLRTGLGWTRHTTTSYVADVYSNYAAYNTSNPVLSAYLLLLPNDR